MDSLSCVFSSDFHMVLNFKLQNLLVVAKEEEKTEQLQVEKNKLNEQFGCSSCQMFFDDVIAQREHFKLDSHASKLKESTGILQEHVETTMNTRYATSQGKMYLKTDQDKAFSIYKCLVFNKKEPYDGNLLTQRLKTCCVDNTYWTILMIGGGHFAGAIFQGTNVILHKCFNFYIVRKSQGGTQSSKDNSSGTSKPKSAGASLRRQNEQALIKAIQNLKEAWQEKIDSSSVIFYSGAGASNKSMLFGGSNPILTKNDPRVRKIPTPIHKVTFKELLRIHERLRSVKMFANVETAMQEIDKFKILTEKPDKKIEKHVDDLDFGKTIDDDSSSESDFEDNQQFENDEKETLNDIQDNFENTEKKELILSDTEENLQNIQEPTLKTKNKKKKPKKKKTLQIETNNGRQQLLNAIDTCDITKLKQLYENKGNVEDQNMPWHEAIDEDGNHLIHLVALGGHVELLKFLLENDFDPSIKNKKHQTPYSITDNKEVREAMKEFARENPDRYHYNKAHIPVNFLSKEEMAEKKKIQRNKNKEKKKLKKEEQKLKTAEENEKARFLQLSDREKAALAAERRILMQNGVVKSRCFLCATDIAGKVPFEYLQYRFCSMDCLKAHRIANSRI